MANVEIHSAHSVAVALPDGQTLIQLTGVLAPVLKGGDNLEWARHTVTAQIPIGRAVSAVSQWAPSVSLASIDADAETSKPGWAIDEFGLVNPGAGDTVTLELQAAVRDPACFLLRIAYNITLVATLA